MPNPIIYIDRSRVHAGSAERLKQGIDEVVAFIESKEPQLLYYGFHLSDDGSRMTVVAIHPDTASVELHMDVGAAAFKSLAEFIELEAIEVYGETSDRMLEQLHRKAEMLGDGNTQVIVDGLHAGFARLEAPTTSP